MTTLSILREEKGTISTRQIYIKETRRKLTAFMDIILTTTLTQVTKKTNISTTKISGFTE
jgi:hypothetical protein